MEIHMCQRYLHTTAVAAAFAFCFACSSGSDEQVAGIDGGGVRNPVTAQGPIQGFGSIVVNDVHYELTAAQIRANGALVSESDLALGQLVTIVGGAEADGSNAVAETVVFEANVHGPVDSVDASMGRLMVMGQDVYTDVATVFDLGEGATGLASIEIDDVLSVSGFVTAEGAIQATRIESLEDKDDLRVLGVISGLDTAEFRFDINGLTVSYASTQMLEGFPGGEPSNGDAVLVEAKRLNTEGWLLADEVEFWKAPSVGEAGEEAEVEGLITRFVSAVDFDVSGLAITTTQDTDYEGGTEADLQLNVKVQIEGRVDADGVIVASKIEVKDGGVVVGGG